MNRITIAAMTCLFACGLSKAEPQSLREAAKGKVLIGCALMSNALDDPKQAEFIAAQYGVITAENEMKPDQIHKDKGKFAFEAGDKIADFAKAHDMKLVGHTLLWHNQAPKWLFVGDDGKPLSREEALKNLREHITPIMQHYKGRVMGWDVVNEAINDGPELYLRDTPAKRAIGEDFVIQAFKIAHEADPDAELYYNDYNIDQDYKIERGLRMIKELKDAGCRVDAVGIQGHWLLESPPAEKIDAAIAKFAALGVKVHITEMDVDVLPRRAQGAGADITATEREGLDLYKDTAGLPPEVGQKLAARYGELFAVFAKHPGVVTRVTLWGTHDGTSWLNNWPVRGRTNHALLFTRDLQAKPALVKVIEQLSKMPAGK